MLVYGVFKFMDTWVWAKDLLPRQGLTFDQMFHGLAYGEWLLWAELLCIVIPAVILLIPPVRNKWGFYYLALFLGVIGVTINRYVQTVQTLALPVMPFDSWFTYIPNWAEWGACCLVLGFAGLVMSLAYRYLPMFPQERELNPD